MEGKAWGRDQMIGLLLAFAVFVLQWHFGLISVTQVDSIWKSVWLPYVLLLGFFTLFQLIRAPWRLDQERELAYEKEKLRREAVEAELDSKADMQGTIWVRVKPGNPLIDQSSPGSEFSCFMECSNFGRKSCQISKVRAVVRHGDLAEPVWLEFSLYEPAVKTVAYGERFHEEGSFVVRGLMPDQLESAEITIYLVDSLGVEYRGIVTKWSPRIT